MNQEQETLIERQKEAGLSTRAFLKVRNDKRAFEPDCLENLYTPEEFEDYPLWGIAGGNGLVPIDTDNEEMAAIIRRILPQTFEAISPRRRLPHFYFAVTDGVVPHRTLHCEGDTKGAGEIRTSGYLVAPGTEVKYKDLTTGEEKMGRYTILNNRPIAKVSFADFMNAVSPYLGADTDQKITHEKMREGVDEGTRHAYGIRYASFLLGVQKLDPITALHEMRRWNEKNRPPMGEYDLERMVQNATRYVGQANPPNRTTDTSEVPREKDIMDSTTEVTQVGDSDPHFRIKILGKNFMLTLPQLMRPTEFRKQFLCHFGALIDIKPRDWMEIVTHWMSIRNIGTELSPDDETRERILEHLCECRVYQSTKQTVTSRRALFWDETEPEKIYCPAHALQEMLAEEGRQTSMTKLHFILVDYLNTGSVVKRVGAVTRRFWEFDLKKVGIDLEHQLVEEKEPEEKDGV